MHNFKHTSEHIFEFLRLVPFGREVYILSAELFDPAPIVLRPAVRQPTLQADEVPAWWSLHTNLDLRRPISVPLCPAPTELTDKRALCHCAPEGGEIHYLTCVADWDTTDSNGPVMRRQREVNR